jgi:polysaccharide biosynthesis/export protein PslD
MTYERTSPVGPGRKAAHGIGPWSLLLLATLAMAASACAGSSRKAQGGGAMMTAQSPTAPGGPGDSAAFGALAASADPGGSAPADPDKLLDEYTYRLAPGDLIDVKFPYHPEENERVPVRPDGRIGLQVVGDVMAAGLTVKELEQVVVDKSSKTLRDPVVSIVIAQLAEHKVYVGGQVAKPGFVPYREGMTPLQAIVERGGFVDDANTDTILYITRVGDAVQSQRLDLEAVMDGESSEQVVMSPDDIIIVPRTFIGEADVWVDQWIRGLLPTVPRPGVDLNSLAF